MAILNLSGRNFENWTLMSIIHTKLLAIDCSCNNALIDVATGESACEFLHNGQGMDYLILVGTYFIIVFTLTGLLMGYVADKIHRPRLLAVCVALFSISATAMGFATQYWHLALLRMTIAIG